MFFVISYTLKKTSAWGKYLCKVKLIQNFSANNAEAFILKDLKKALQSGNTLPNAQFIKQWKQANILEVKYWAWIPHPFELLKDTLLFLYPQQNFWIIDMGIE